MTCQYTTAELPYLYVLTKPRVTTARKTFVMETVYRSQLLSSTPTDIFGTAARCIIAICINNISYISSANYSSSPSLKVLIF